MATRAARAGNNPPGRRKQKDNQPVATPKNLKKLTRARMERTGESYTTARKAILTDRPEPVFAQRAAERTAKDYSKSGKSSAKPAPQAAELPADELPEYPAPHNVQQYDAALWHRVLTQSGVVHPQTKQPLSEALLFGLGGGIGFMLHSFAQADALNLALVTRAHPEPFTATLLERSGAKVRIRTTGNAQAAEANLDAGLDAGRAVIVRVSRAALPWEDETQLDAADTIDVAVLGDMDDSLIIDEGAAEPRLINGQDLAYARAKHKRDKNYCAWVPARRAPKPEELAANVRAALEQSTSRMLGTAELPGLPAHYARNFGVAGMEQFAERLADATGEAGWARIMANPTLRQDALAQLEQFFTERRFAAADGFRGLFGDFLTEASTLPTLAPLAEHVAGYRLLAVDWEDFTQGLRSCLNVTAHSAELSTLGAQFRSLAAAEAKAANALADTVKSLAAAR